MSASDAFGWRDRAIALASLGAAALSRVAFPLNDVIELRPIEMQALVALALQDSLATGPPRRTGTQWLGRALRVDREAVDDAVHRLEAAGLVYRSVDALDEIHHELGEYETPDLVAGELPLHLTELGFETVERWLIQTRPYFRNWPPERPGVDDAIS